MYVKEVEVKTCMTKSKLTDYVINPYTGCEHGCNYCYADFMRRFHNIPDKWGDFLFVKANSLEFLEKELEKSKPGHIWMSSVCDCYTPSERKYRLTRRILEIIANSPYRKKFTMEILTKSSLVKRDFDLLKKLDVELGFSINNLNDKIASILEPGASPPSERVKTLKEARKFGIRIFGFISPVLPGITNLEDIFKELSFCDYVWVEFLNIKKSVLERLMPIIRKNFPDKIKDFEFVINNPQEYYNEMEKKVRELEKKYKLKVKDVVIHQELDLK